MTKRIIKKIFLIILSGIFTFSVNYHVFASVKPEVWAYNEKDTGYVPEIEKVIVSHIPGHTINALNLHNGSIVINNTKCDELGIAGMTNGVPTETGWYKWPDGNVYIDLTPSYGLNTMKETVLHEFGHVFDMEKKATNSVPIQFILKSELSFYNSLEESTGYMIPPVKNEHELFAQVYAAVVSNDDGTVRSSREIKKYCPGTANYIEWLLKNS